MTAKAKTNGKPADPLADHPAMKIGNKRRYTRPKCGRYDGVPFAEYNAWPHIRRSEFVWATRSAAHYKWRLENPVEPSREMVIGCAIHMLILEPEAFHDSFAVEPDFLEQGPILKQDCTIAKDPKRTKQYGKRRDKWRRQHPGKQFLTHDEFDRAQSAARAADIALPAKYESEVSLIADCPETNMRLKARLDVLDSDRDTIWDIKTTASADAFEWYLERFPFRYDIQAAYYQDAAEWVLGEKFGFGFIVVERIEPYGVRKALLSGDVIEDGRRDYCQALRRIRDAQHSGVWSGYTEQPYFRRRNDPRIDVEVDGAVMTIGR